MLNISTFIVFIFLGFTIGRFPSFEIIHEKIKLASTVTLLLFIFLMFGELEFPRNNLLLILPYVVLLGLAECDRRLPPPLTAPCAPN
jgi:hypothetical protein